MSSYDEMLELLRTQRSIRTFTSQSVDKNIIKKIISAACLAPSTNKSQSTHFIIV
jgi:nitroreductase